MRLNRLEGGIRGRWWQARGLEHRLQIQQHLGVAGESPHQSEQALDRLHWLVPCQPTAYQIDFLELVRWEQQFLAARTRFENIDRGEDVLLRDLPIEDELHISGSFKLLEYDIVHP